jgi:saccharopepsin
MGFCTIDCATRDSLPNLEFVLSGHNFSLTPYEYTFEADMEFPRAERPLCVSAVFPIDPEYVDPKPQVQLGLGFLLKYYSVFNMTDGSIGLALKSR